MAVLNTNVQIPKYKPIFDIIAREKRTREEVSADFLFRFLGIYGLQKAPYFGPGLAGAAAIFIGEEALRIRYGFKSRLPCHISKCR